MSCLEEPTSFKPPVSEEETIATHRAHYASYVDLDIVTRDVASGCMWFSPITRRAACRMQARMEAERQLRPPEPP